MSTGFGLVYRINKFLLDAIERSKELGDLGALVFELGDCVIDPRNPTSDFVSRLAISLKIRFEPVVSG